ncbi:MAG: hypothetical protein GX053_11280, partial [Tissierella sp.]|nr:hypothetical protein [Tissierella sp.]
MNRAIEGVEDTQKAKDAVAIVEVTELRKDYTSADKLVTAITEREEFDGYIDGNFIAIKQGLINQLKIVLPKIETEEAKVAVTKVENSLTQKDLDAAKEAVEKNGVKAFDENQYNVLKEKLDVVEAVIFITNEVADAERNSEEYVTEDVIKGITNIDNQIVGIVNGIKNSLVEEIEKIPNATTAMVNRRSDLTNRLNTLDNVWEGIVAVRYAEYIYKEVGNSEPTLTNAIKFANTKIPDVGNSKVKQDLEKRIETIVNELAANDSYEEANNKVTAIEGIL